MNTKQRNKPVMKKFVQALAAELRRLRVKSVVITYDGCGDEGQIETPEIKCEKGAQVKETELIRVPKLVQGRHDRNYDYLYTLGEPEFRKLGEVLDEFAETMIEVSGYAGWENGNGACGDLTIDAKAGTAKLKHNWRVEEYETEEDSL